MLYFALDSDYPEIIQNAMRDFLQVKVSGLRIDNVSTSFASDLPEVALSMAAGGVFNSKRRPWFFQNTGLIEAKTNVKFRRGDTVLVAHADGLYSFVEFD